MKVFERYTLKELQEAIGDFFWIKDRNAYNKMYAPYKAIAASNCNFIEEAKGATEYNKYNIGTLSHYGYPYSDGDIIRAIHALEIPFNEIPLYVNTGSELTRRILKFRLDKSK